jgi:ankyrin repeat protein
VKAFPERSVPLNNANEKVDSLLLLAARCGKIKVFCYLTEIGADINIRNTNRDITRHKAAISGSVEIIKILLDKGMSVDLKNAKDSMPLRFSASKGNNKSSCRKSCFFNKCW